jgi:hypothetical protein
MLLREMGCPRRDTPTGNYLKLPDPFTKNDRWLPWIVFPGILLIYLLFPSKNYYWDGIFFARVIEDARALTPSLLHPNHLLYNVAGYFFYKCARSLGLNWRAVEVLQVANSVVSVVTALLLFTILKRSLKSNYLAWTLTLLFAFSATWWKFSTDANAYILSVFFLLLAFYFVLPNSKPRPVLVAIIFSVSVLLHQLAVFCYPLLVLGLWWQASSYPAKQRNLTVMQFCFPAFAFVFGAYVYCFYLIAGVFDSARFARWITSYSPDASFSFNAISNLGYVLRGHFRLFFSGRFPLLEGLLTPVIVGLICLLIALSLLWLFLIIRGLRKPSWPSCREILLSRLAKLAGLWIVVYVVFLFFWLPQNTFYRLFYLPAIILLLGEILAACGAGESTKRSYRFALFVVLMALANFLFFIFPYSHAEKYPPLSAALEMNKVWRPGTIVFYASENSDNNLFQYFNPETEWKPLPQFDQFEAELRKSYDSGKEVWVEATAIDELNSVSRGVKWFESHSQANTLHERRDRGYNIRFIRIVP